MTERSQPTREYWLARGVPHHWYVTPDGNRCSSPEEAMKTDPAQTQKYDGLDAWNEALSDLYLAAEEADCNGSLLPPTVKAALDRIRTVRDKP